MDPNVSTTWPSGPDLPPSTNSTPRRPSLVDLDSDQGSEEEKGVVTGGYSLRVRPSDLTRSLDTVEVGETEEVPSSVPQGEGSPGVCVSPFPSP